VFGDRIAQLPVTSIKSMIGQLLGAAGAVEAAALALSVARGAIPPTIHHTETDANSRWTSSPTRRASNASGAPSRRRSGSAATIPPS